MFLYNNPYITSQLPTFEQGAEIGVPIDATINSSVTPNTASWVDGEGRTRTATRNPDNTGWLSTDEFIDVEENAEEEVEETIYTDHDNAYDYKLIDGVWHSQEKGGTDWKSFETLDPADRTIAENKLNTKYPDAMSVDNSTKDKDKDDKTDIDNANKKIEEGTDAVFYDDEFRSPEEANLLSGIGDTGLFDLIKAIDTTVGSFKKENYYDPGSKMDYLKADFKNTTDEGLYFDSEQFMKTPHKAGKFLIDEEQSKEKDIQSFLDQRHKRNPDKYSKVKDFDIDLYNETGHMDYRKGLFNRKHEGYQGDLLEEKYSDASHIGWETDKMGKYNKAFDYLTGDPDDETMFNQQDFDDGFDRPLIGPTLDPDDPNSYNYSKEYLESSKHNPNIYFEKGDNSNINPNFMGDGRFSKRIPKPNDPNDFTNPQNVINANDKLRDEEAKRRQQEAHADYIENQVRKSQGKRYGGSLPKAEFGLDAYSQGINPSYSSGYNPFSNQEDPFNFDFSPSNNFDLYGNYPKAANVNSTPPENEPYYNSEDRIFAMQQSVNRSMNNWDAFTADMNNRIQNPSLSFNEVDTNPLNTPSIGLDPNLTNEIKMMGDMSENRLRRTDPSAWAQQKIDDMKISSKEFSEEMDDQTDAFKYKGKRKHVKELEKSQELGFDDRNEYLDYLNEQKKEDFLRTERERQLNKDNKDGMSFGDHLWNTKNRILDSTAVQTGSKVAAGAVRIAKPLNRMLEMREENKRKKMMMDNAYLSDNMYASNDADLTGSKGDYDVNTGIFRPDDKVTPGTTMTKFGGSFFNDGGEMEIDMITYKQLVSAGAQIEIL
tara:strand:+ start:535 stop:3006 length:2472 start_codon:yes stop_codon:yes gene_type:complete